MKNRFVVIAALLGLAMFLALSAAARAGASDKDKEKEASAASSTHSAQDDTLRLEGEKRFHANCGRCHAAPRKFAPRAMATIVRHMRIRAMLTDEDTSLILRYMTQ